MESNSSSVDLVRYRYSTIYLPQEGVQQTKIWYLRVHRYPLFQPIACHFPQQPP